LHDKRNYRKQKFMKKSISVNKKPRGRPKKKGGVDPVSAVRLPEGLTAKVDRWAEEHEASRSEAIRRLVEIGLSKPSHQPRVLSTSKQAAARAAELAAKAIDKQSDPSLTPEERTTRKRKLIEGPSPFRDARVDRAKKR
jgi:Arc/MetJ-type ribon-helix-helix transcriptional regulator